MIVNKIDGMVEIRMVTADFERLLFLLGLASGGMAREGNMAGFWSAIAFINRLNEGNPEFTPYEIPKKGK